MRRHGAEALLSLTLQCVLPKEYMQTTGRWQRKGGAPKVPQVQESLSYKAAKR